MWSRSRLTRFILRTSWAKDYASALRGYTGRVFERRDVEPKRLERIFGDVTADRVQMMAQLDLLSRGPVGGRQLAAEYLAADGADESETDRILLRAVEGTVHSLYDVLEVGPGDRLLLKDTIIGGTPVVLDQQRMATDVVTGDILFARLVTLPDATLTTAGSVFTLPDSQIALVNDTLVPRLRAQALLSLEAGRQLDPRAGVAPLFCAVLVLASENAAVAASGEAPGSRRSPWAIDDPN